MGSDVRTNKQITRKQDIRVVSSASISASIVPGASPITATMLSIRKFTNPCDLSTATQVCSRSDIFNNSNDVQFPERDSAFDEETKWLDDYLRDSIAYPSESGVDGDGVQERPKKRRKKNGEVRAKHEESSVFGTHICSR